MCPSKRDDIKPGADGLYDFSEIVAADMKKLSYAALYFEQCYRDKDMVKAVKDTIRLMDLEWVAETLDTHIENVKEFIQPDDNPTLEESLMYLSFIYTGRDISLDPRRGNHVYEEEKEEQSSSGDAGAD